MYRIRTTSGLRLLYISIVASLAMSVLVGCSVLEPKPRPPLDSADVIGTWVHEDRSGQRSEITFSDSGEFFKSNIPQKVFDFLSPASSRPGFGDDLNWKMVGEFSGAWSIDKDNRDIHMSIEGGPLGVGGGMPLGFGGTREVPSIGTLVGLPDDLNRFEFYRVFSND